MRRCCHPWPRPTASCPRTCAGRQERCRQSRWVPAWCGGKQEDRAAAIAGLLAEGSGADESLCEFYAIVFAGITRLHAVRRVSPFPGRAAYGTVQAASYPVRPSQICDALAGRTSSCQGIVTGRGGFWRKPCLQMRHQHGMIPIDAPDAVLSHPMHPVPMTRCMDVSG
jgi:hypothetical protein